MINEAAINAVKQGRKYVNQSDLFESVEVVIAGKEKKDRIMGPKEKKTARSSAFLRCAYGRSRRSVERFPATVFLQIARGY